MKSSDLFTVKILHIEIQVALAPLLYLCAGGLQFGSWQGQDAFGYPVEDFEKWIYYIMLFTDLVLLNKTTRVDMDGIVIARCFGLLKRTYRFDDFNYGYVECENGETLSVYLVKQPVYRDKNSRKLVGRKFISDAENTDAGFEMESVPA